jgi:hypothetical protein
MKTHDEEIRLARDAERLMGDPVFKSAIEGIESALIDRMRLVPMADKDTQHELILTLQLLGNLKAHFVEMIQTGKMAEIQKEQSLAQKVKRLVRS